MSPKRRAATPKLQAPKRIPATDRARPKHPHPWGHLFHVKHTPGLFIFLSIYVLIPIASVVPVTQRPPTTSPNASPSRKCLNASTTKRQPRPRLVTTNERTAHQTHLRQQGSGPVARRAVTEARRNASRTGTTCVSKTYASHSTVTPQKSTQARQNIRPHHVTTRLPSAPDTQLGITAHTEHSTDGGATRLVTPTHRALTPRRCHTGDRRQRSPRPHGADQGHMAPNVTSRESHRRSPSSYGRSPAPRRQPGQVLRGPQQKQARNACEEALRRPLVVPRR